jgi:hypothetical protein
LTVYTDVDSGERNQPLIELINSNFRALLTGQGQTPMRPMTATGSILTTDEVVTVDATAGAVTLTLPSCASFVLRRRVVVKHTAGANNVTLNPQGSEQIDLLSAGTGLALNSIGDVVELVTDNVKWYRVH